MSPIESLFYMKLKQMFIKFYNIQLFIEKNTLIWIFNFHSKYFWVGQTLNAMQGKRGFQHTSISNHAQKYYESTIQNKRYMWDLRFSQQLVWILLSYEIWCCVVWQMVPTLVLSLSKMKAAHSSKIFIPIKLHGIISKKTVILKHT